MSTETLVLYNEILLRDDQNSWKSIISSKWRTQCSSWTVLPFSLGAYSNEHCCKLILSNGWWLGHDLSNHDSRSKLGMTNRHNLKHIWSVERIRFDTKIKKFPCFLITQHFTKEKSGKVESHEEMEIVSKIKLKRKFKSWISCLWRILRIPWRRGLAKYTLIRLLNRLKMEVVK